MALRKPAPRRKVDGEPVLIGENVSADEYFAMPETVIPHDLIEGRLYVSPSPFWNHQELVLGLVVRFKRFADEHGGKAFVSPMDCRLSDRTVLQPDLGYIVAERTGIIQRHVMGAPDVVVEVLSPGTRRFDRQQKLVAYGHNGVREAWLVDPEAGTVTVFSGDGSRWTGEQTVRFGEPIPSAVLAIGDAGLSARR
jgi:Uma2 family endonuclease